MAATLTRDHGECYSDLVARGDAPTSPARVLTYGLAAGVPLAAYLATMSGHGDWADSGKTVAAAISLSFGLPPSHPVASVVGKAATWIPLGSLPLRVALMSATLTAVAAGVTFRAIERSVVVIGAHRMVATVLGVAAVWLASATQAWWLEATRPDVDPVQAALLAVVLERVVAFEQRWPVFDMRPLYTAALALGLAFAAHPVTTWWVLPAVAPIAARVVGSRGSRPLWRAMGALAAGLAACVSVPLRPPTPLALHGGDGTARGWLAWAWRGASESAAWSMSEPAPPWRPPFEAATELGTVLYGVPVALAAVGLVIGWRLPGARRIAGLWLGIAVTWVAGTAWWQPASSAMMPAYGAMTALAAIGAASILRALQPPVVDRGPVLPVVGAIALATVTLAQFPATASQVSRATFTAPDAFDDPLRRMLPNRAVVLAHTPATVFRLWSGAAVERLRPDVTVVPMPLLDAPGTATALVERNPGLGPFVRSYLLQGELRAPPLQSLATERPVYLEMHPRVPRALDTTLVPEGLYHRVLADGATHADVKVGAGSRRRAWERLLRLLEPSDYTPDTSARLAWHRYTGALYYAGYGDRARARIAARKALEIDPDHARARRLLAALKNDDGKGPVEIPFRPSD